ncbi:hypothetical protein L6164_037844 [Bauhinia variegata]|uniref:Uncharacterized protein n=1 Tax=Bauhinia variegata TaxID=167791 RepID=A0ACB9KLE2_BAUVA|nr:hypothetical protein L6164_037844 [Bauhinia variegata]
MWHSRMVKLSKWKKFRHYLLEHQIQLISRVDPIKDLMTKAVLTGRLAKWALTLLEYDREYVPKMYFDEASSIEPALRPRIPRVKVGIGLVFITPELARYHKRAMHLLNKIPQVKLEKTDRPSQFD